MQVQMKKSHISVYAHVCIYTCMHMFMYMRISVGFESEVFALEFDSFMDGNLCKPKSRNNTYLCMYVYAYIFVYTNDSSLGSWRSNSLHLMTLICASLNKEITHMCIYTCMRIFIHMCISVGFESEVLALEFDSFNDCYVSKNKERNNTYLYIHMCVYIHMHAYIIYICRF